MMHRLGSSSDQLGVSEGVADYSADGKGINVTAKFFVAFTEDREQAYRLLQRKHLETMNQLQYYFSETFTIKNATSQMKHLAAQKAQQLKTFNSYIDSHGILEVQLLPVPYPDNDSDLFDTLNLRVTRFKKDRSKPLDPEELLQAVCEYALHGQRCSSIKTVRPVLLDGDDLETSVAGLFQNDN